MDFFLSGFSFTDTDESQDSRESERTIFYSTLPLHPLTNIQPYHKIPLIRHGRIYGQRKNFMGLFSGGVGGAYIPEDKHFNLQSVKLVTFFSFYQIF